MNHSQHTNGTRLLVLLGIPALAIVQTVVLFLVLGFSLYVARQQLPRDFLAEGVMLPFAVFAAATCIVQFATPWTAARALRSSAWSRAYLVTCLFIAYSILAFDTFGWWRMENSLAHDFWVAWTFAGC